MRFLVKKTFRLGHRFDFFLIRFFGFFYIFLFLLFLYFKSYYSIVILFLPEYFFFVSHVFLFLRYFFSDSYNVITLKKIHNLKQLSIFKLWLYHCYLSSFNKFYLCLCRKKINHISFILSLFIFFTGVPFRFLKLVFNLIKVQNLNPVLPSYSKRNNWDLKKRLEVVTFLLYRKLVNLKIEFINKTYTLNGYDFKHLLLHSARLLKTPELDKIILFLKSLEYEVYRFNFYEDRAAVYEFKKIYDPSIDKFHYHYLTKDGCSLHPTSNSNFKLSNNQQSLPPVWTGTHHKVFNRPKELEPALIFESNLSEDRLSALVPTKEAASLSISVPEVNGSLLFLKDESILENDYKEYILYKQHSFNDVCDKFGISDDEERLKFVSSLCANSYNLPFSHFDLDIFKKEHEGLLKLGSLPINDNKII